ncbi:MAG: HTTM domain-containing protein [Myxococcota bacterium]
MIARWVALWNQREAPTSLACVRILVAAVLLVDLLAAWGLHALPALWAPPPNGFGWGASATEPTNSPSLLIRAFGSSEHTAMMAWLLAVGCGLAVLFGAAFRLTSWLFTLAMLELMAFTPDGDAIDHILRFVLPLLALSDAHATFSVDAWLRARRRKQSPASLDDPRPVFAWPRYLIAIQLLWVYFSAAHHRGKASWGLAGGFSAIGDVLGDPHFTRFPPGTFAALYPLTQLASLLTMAFEFSAPCYLLFDYWHRHPSRGGAVANWSRRLHLREVWLALGVSLHLGIAASMELGIFPFAILALYPALIHPDDLSRMFAGAKALLARASPTRASLRSE